MKGRKKGFLVVAKMAAFVTLGLFLCGLIGVGELRAANPLLEAIYEIVLDTNNKLTPAPCEGAPVEKTGQTKCYEASGTEIPCSDTGQDGDLQKGVAWPTPRFTDNIDGTVTDNLTGLIWLKNANCANTTVDWNTAIDYAAALYDGCTSCFDTVGDCGLGDGSLAGDWRLPNVKELHSLIDYGYSGPALSNAAGAGKWSEDDPFTGVQSLYYWSSTTHATYTYFVWLVSFLNGGVNGHGRGYDYYVWCVRGGN